MTGDDHQLRQVVANLLGNARKHTPPGSPVRVRLTGAPKAEGGGAGGGEAVLEVADEGPGLEPEVAAKVFEPFYRADGSRARQSGGAGLGLAIVAAIVEAHGGHVALVAAHRRTAPPSRCACPWRRRCELTDGGLAGPRAALLHAGARLEQGQARSPLAGGTIPSAHNPNQWSRV